MSSRGLIGFLTELLGMFVLLIGLLVTVSSTVIGGRFLENAFVALIGFLIMYGGGYLKNYGKRIGQETGEQTLNLGKQVVTLFRNFGRDNTDSLPPRHSFIEYINPLAGREPWTFEKSLAEIFVSIGPLVALGRPGEWAPPQGASRIYVDHSEWKNRVRTILSQTVLAVMIIDASPSLAWELDIIIEKLGIHRLFLLTPRSFLVTDVEKSRTAWNLLKNRLPQLAKYEDTVKILGIGFTEYGVPQIVSSESFDTREWDSILKQYVMQRYHKGR